MSRVQKDCSSYRWNGKQSEQSIEQCEEWNVKFGAEWTGRSGLIKQNWKIL